MPLGKTDSHVHMQTKIQIDMYIKTDGKKHSQHTVLFDTFINFFFHLADNLQMRNIKSNLS